MLEVGNRNLKYLSSGKEDLGVLFWKRLMRVYFFNEWFVPNDETLEIPHPDHKRLEMFQKQPLESLFGINMA
jgi:hypothetical protein